MKSFFSKRRSGPQLQKAQPRIQIEGTLADDSPERQLEEDYTQEGPRIEASHLDANRTNEGGNLQADIGDDFSNVVDACAEHPVIEAAIASLQTLKVFVTRDGIVYFVEHPHRVRPLEQLVALVRQELGCAIAKPISLITYSKLRSQAVRKRQDSVTHNDLVEMVLHDAIAKKSSDVYIAVHNDRTQIHMRTHGQRYEHAEISKEDGEQMVRSLWSISKKDQHEQDETTDTSFSFGGVRVRANSMPDTRGNSVVLRLRDPTFIPALDELGYNVSQQRLIDELQWSAGGLAVISGETNSGKSTTLTSMMAGMPKTEMIIEIADPIEIEFDHVTHMEIDHYAEDSEQRFRGMLGGLVRQNPDTLFIGEIRDLQSAKAAIDMSLQGKRVWGTVHSHSCLSTLSRLEHLGIDVNLLSQPGFLNGVVNQSLVPIVCVKCCRATLDNDVTTTRLHRKFHSTQLRFHNPDGCSDCVRGISGQTVVAEVMAFPSDPSHPARQFIREHDLAGLAKSMREEGMITKAAHAVTKIQDGLLDPILTEKVIGRIGTRDALPVDIESQIRSRTARQNGHGVL